MDISHNSAPVAGKSKRGKRSFRDWSEEESKMVKLGVGWACTLCDYMHDNKHEVRIHVEGKHGTFQALPCPYCNNTFKNKNSLKSHKYTCRHNPKGHVWPKPIG